MKACINPSCPVPVEKQKFYFKRAYNQAMSQCMECHRSKVKARYWQKRDEILAKAADIKAQRKAMRTMEVNA
jgi:hypothetical protein